MKDLDSIQGFLSLKDIYMDRDSFQAYRTRWSIKPLLEASTELTAAQKKFLKSIETKFEALPDDSIADSSPLTEHEIAALNRYFFAPFRRNNQFGLIAKPFLFDQIFLTPVGFDLMNSGRIEQDTNRVYNSATVRAGMHILNQVYGQQIPHLESTELNYRDEDSKLYSHFMMKSNLDFIKVKVHGKKPDLSLGQIRMLLANPDDIELWQKKLPVESFSFEGIEVVESIDLTPQIARGRLQHLLLKREAVLSPERIDKLAKVLRNLLQVPDLEFGIHAIDYPERYKVAHRYLVSQDLLENKFRDFLDPAYGRTIYSETCGFGDVKIFDNLKDCIGDEDVIADSFLSKGFKSLILVPLFGKEDHILGMVQLASKRSFAFTSLVITQIESVLPLFRQAIRRTRTDMEFRIQSVMRQTFTDLDPRLEWRFIKAAADLIDQTTDQNDSVPVIDPIRFEKVWALYGQADIVGSSKLRNDAVRKDMVAELSAAVKLLEAPAIDLLYPLAGKLVFDGKKLLARLTDEMSPNDEQEVQRFLAVSFKPTLKQLSSTKEAKQRVKTYKDEIATAMENGLTNREAYEQSVARLSRAISRAVIQGEEEAQRIIPHYFSKYRTDGIEFNIYAGQSLLPSGKFTKVHLQNLRLWQLKTLINVTKSVAGLQESLPVPMTTAQLIFAYGQPITIQFRMDEKRFDVEGAYNVRYEVIKKRIDKALVLGTEERLTQPNHLAVVFTHVTDRQIYLELLHYLCESGQVAGPVEELELEPMQGVDGLMALRIKVL
jgi:hypothetical protein